MQISRRKALLLLASGGATAGLYGVVQYAQADTISAPEALTRVQAGRLILVDIRRPDEWQATGVAQGAHPVDMRDEDFIAELDALTGGDRSKPIAMICAKGVRSRWMAARLRVSGYENVVDVREGMLGSSAGAGWVARGLPVASYK